jgi:hypothetical protein
VSLHTQSWTGTNGAAFLTGTNWNPSGVPSSTSALVVSGSSVPAAPASGVTVGAILAAGITTAWPADSNNNLTVATGGVAILGSSAAAPASTWSSLFADNTVQGTFWNTSVNGDALSGNPLSNLLLRGTSSFVSATCHNLALADEAYAIGAALTGTVTISTTGSAGTPYPGAALAADNGDNLDLNGVTSLVLNVGTNLAETNAAEVASGPGFFGQVILPPASSIVCNAGSTLGLMLSSSTSTGGAVVMRIAPALPGGGGVSIGPGPGVSI